MSWLTKFKADPQNLIGPNITKSPVHEIDLSGTILILIKTLLMRKALVVKTMPA